MHMHIHLFSPDEPHRRWQDMLLHSECENHQLDLKSWIVNVALTLVTLLHARFVIRDSIRLAWLFGHFTETVRSVW